MKHDDDQITLATLGHGAAEELFQAALQKVLANIDDPNTEAKVKREVTLKIAFLPSEDRSVVASHVRIDTKLASRRDAKMTLFVGHDVAKKRYIARQHNPKQGSLPYVDEKDGALPREGSEPTEN